MTRHVTLIGVSPFLGPIWRPGDGRALGGGGGGAPPQGATMTTGTEQNGMNMSNVIGYLDPALASIFGGGIAASGSCTDPMVAGFYTSGQWVSIHLHAGSPTNLQTLKINGTPYALFYDGEAPEGYPFYYIEEGIGPFAENTEYTIEFVA